MKISKLLPYLFIILFFLTSCKDKQKNDNSENNTNNVDSTDTNENLVSLNIDAKIEILSENPGVCGKNVKISFKINDSTKIDSVQIWFSDKKIKTYIESDFTLEIDTKNESVGAKLIIAQIYSDNKNASVKANIVLLSDIIPVNKKYKIIKEFPHDVNAYTQGLVYEEGVLYEATGLETKSTLRKVKLETGEVLYGITIPNNVFGEGITIFNDKLVQITWRDHVGYVYDKNSFQVLSEFNFNTEGWGLTTDGEFLYMSDGTHVIYVLDPNTYSVIKQIPVFDNKDRIFYINELEYINGYLYANIYLQEYILKIDLKTGKVLEKINFSGLLPNSLKTQNTDVLNGIAYDKKNNRIFVTGKNWARLYQVEFIN